MLRGYPMFTMDYDRIRSSVHKYLTFPLWSALHGRFRAFTLAGKSHLVKLTGLSVEYRNQ